MSKRDGLKTGDVIDQDFAKETLLSIINHIGERDGSKVDLMIMVETIVSAIIMTVSDRDAMDEEVVLLLAKHVRKAVKEARSKGVKLAS